MFKTLNSRLIHNKTMQEFDSDAFINKKHFQYPKFWIDSKYGNHKNFEIHSIINIVVDSVD